MGKNSLKKCNGARCVHLDLYAGAAGVTTCIRNLDEAALPIGLAGVRRPGEGYFEPDKYMKEHGHPGRVGGMLSRGSDSRQAQNLVDQFKTWAGGGTEPGLGVEDPERVIRWYKRRNKEDEKKANIIALDLAAQK